jgi:hypothetical protein
VKPATLVSVAGLTIGVALVCEALSGVLRVGVVRTGAVVAGPELAGAGDAAPSSARLTAVRADAEATRRIRADVRWILMVIGKLATWCRGLVIVEYLSRK